MRRYPKYKESGVEWIGEVPKGWNMIRCTHLFELKHIKNTSGEINLSVYRDYGVIKRDSRDDNYNRVSEDTSNYKLVEPGDFVFNKMKCWQGSLGVSEYRGIVSPAYTVCKPKRHFHGKYFHYLLRSQPYIQEFNRLSYGVRIGQWELRFEDFKDIVVLYPSLSEQTQIANFLDRKTEQIDELIRIKERQIELLQEQRTALINQAVTKGLDPNVEMKPSGVEWIGEIPAHWEIKRLKHVAKILPSNVDKHIYPDEIQVRLCNYTDVYYNDYITVDTALKKGSCKESEFAKFVLRKGDVIITKDSETPDDIGVPTFVKDDLDNVVCGYHLTMIRPLACLGEFIFRFIQSDKTRRYFEVNSNGITRYGLGKASIENLLLPIPPDSEQQQIANLLDRKTKQIDELIAAEQRKIERLKEYRQSLISEAVTGKIDVRNEV
ncbi:restriction endonuclease subunit S [Candidatus Poribacteria bacterium]|nr:restriction endonuclease subunit S [Candidatus Poribacteria bacterium]